MKKLFKTLITVITVVCMLSSMTALAASQSTVTKYGSTTNVNVETTVSGIAQDVIVTYLVAKDANENGTADADEIKYINQATSDGSDITFSYAITGGAWEAEKTIADVQFGSNDADTAAALNDDVVVFDDIEFIVKDAEGNAVAEAAEISKSAIGKGDVYTDVVISALPGYTISSIKIGGVLVDETLAAHTVKYGDTVEVVVAAIEDTTVYFFNDATVADGLEIYDQDDNKLFVKTGIGYYVGGPVDSAAIVFDGCNIDGEHANFTYAAADVDKEAKSAYFAVQLASANEADLAPATKAIVTVGEDVVESK